MFSIVKSPSVSLRAPRFACGGEDGRISLLMLGLGMIVFMVLALGANVTVLHLERSQLQNEADNLAVILATSGKEPSYYADSSVPPSAEGLLAQAQTQLGFLVPLGDNKIAGRRITSVSVEGDTVLLEVRGRLKIPLLTQLWGLDVDTVVFSSARRE